MVAEFRQFTPINLIFRFLGKCQIRACILFLKKTFFFVLFLRIVIKMGMRPPTIATRDDFPLLAINGIPKHRWCLPFLSDFAPRLPRLLTLQNICIETIPLPAAWIKSSLGQNNNNRKRAIFFTIAVFKNVEPLGASDRWRGLALSGTLFPLSQAPGGMSTTRITMCVFEGVLRESLFVARVQHTRKNTQSVGGCVGGIKPHFIYASPWCFFI